MTVHCAVLCLPHCGLVVPLSVLLCILTAPLSVSLTVPFSASLCLLLPDAAPLEIQGMLSAEGEQVLFARTQLTEGSVELWLAKVEQEMRHSLYDHTETCLSSYDTASRPSWLFNHCAMCILVVEQIYWTADCTKALEALEVSCAVSPSHCALTFCLTALVALLCPLPASLVLSLFLTLLSFCLTVLSLSPGWQ